MSDWKERANARRDARATKSPTEVPKALPGKKDTRRWCKGKVGVEHKPECRDYSVVKNAAKDIRGRAIELYKGWKVLVCTGCGKELDRYWPMRIGSIPDEPKPDWVTDG